MVLTSCSEIELSRLPDYLDKIVDRLASYDPRIESTEKRIDFHFAFGQAVFEFPDNGLAMTATAADETGLARVKDLVAVAVQLYAKAENPRIVWTGDLASETRLAQFRLMRVIDVTDVTPRMKRVRLKGDDLARFAMFGGMHIRMLFPTPENPEPVWPVMGPNGLPAWPSEERRPAPRAYTIRQLDIAAGWMDVDFVMHEDHGVGSSWAAHAASGDVIGVMGPVGRPVKPAKWYVLGADETGLPAVSRMLESMTPDTSGIAFIEVENAAEEQPLVHPDGVTVRWLHRNGKPADESPLKQLVCDVEWPQGDHTFGWFAGEAAIAKQIREYWRNQLGYGRDQTLVAGYWQKDMTGFMAG